VPPVKVAKTTDTPADTGAGKAANEAAAPARKSKGSPAGQGDADPAPIVSKTKEPGAPKPTESRPARKPRKTAAKDTPGATKPRKDGDS
jgi:NADH-quinone oxidoreductase subunit C